MKPPIKQTIFNKNKIDSNIHFTTTATNFIDNDQVFSDVIIAGRQTDWTAGETCIFVSLETCLKKLQTLLPCC
jgi:tryptophanase